MWMRACPQWQVSPQFRRQRTALCEDMIKPAPLTGNTGQVTLTCGDVAAAHSDRLTEDLCIERGLIHEKFAWMLRAHIP